jgi:hypothetical protein
MVLHCRLGWLPGTLAIGVLTLLTAYSGFLISRLVQTVSGAVLFGDIGEAAAGSKVVVLASFSQCQCSLMLSFPCKRMVNELCWGHVPQLVAVHHIQVAYVQATSSLNDSPQPI